jgi:hypothetical protein
MTKVYSINAQINDVELLKADTARLSAVIFNNSNKSMYVKLGKGASKEDFSTMLLSGGHWEVPSGHTEAIHAVWGIGCSGDAKISDIRG